MFNVKMLPVLLLFLNPLNLFGSGEVETLPARSLTQRVEVSGHFSGNIKVQVLPLYKDFKWALTSRWDDNAAGEDATMADLLDKYGYKGTFYLMSTGIGSDLERALLRRGHAMGSHSITHPGLTGCTYNKIFEELLKSRIDIETRIDFPVNSFAFPGNDFANDLRPQIQWDIYRLILRAGYTQVAWSRWLPETMKDLSGDVELPGDGHPLEPWFSQLAGNEGLRKQEPNLTLCTHAWAYAQGPKWPLLESQIKLYARNKAYWFCNQAEYGAYRFQYRRARITEMVKTPTGVSFNLVRPLPIDAGREVPLTIKISDTDLSRAAITVDGKTLSADNQSAGSVVFSVPYPVTEKLPEKIDAVYVESKPETSKKFPFLSGMLRLEDKDKNLRLQMTNSGSPITRVLVTYRLPFAAVPGLVGREFPEITKEKPLADTVTLAWPDRSMKLLDGRAMFVAQVDFLSENRPHRLYVVTFKTVTPSDNARNYAMGNFALLGPVPAEETTNGDLFQKVVAHPTATFIMGGGKTFSWQPIPVSDGSASDYVGAGADTFVASIITSPEKQEAIIKCPGQWHIWLNARVVTPDQRVVLEKGENRVLVAAKGSFLWQMVSPETGKRIGNLVFSAPHSDPALKITVLPSRPYRFFIKDWLICGPFPNPGIRPVKKGFDIDYLAGQGGEAQIRPEKNVDTAWNGQKFKWVGFTSPQPKINLFEFPPIQGLKDKNDILIYACCYLEAKRETDVLIGLGSDDGYKLYLNHRLLKTTRAFRGSTPDQEIVPAHLKKGVNVLLLKVDQDFGEYDFQVSLNSPDFGFLDVTPTLSGK
jgi:hypothetical protein